MRNGHFKRASFGLLLCVALLLAGCNMRAKYQRTVQLSAPMSPGSTFTAQTHNGSITTNGADVADCNMVATITARAATEEEAQELAEKVEISLEPSGDTLTAKIKRPTRLVNKSLSVSLDVTLPGQTKLELVTHNGSITVRQTSGNAKLKTHNGSVKAYYADSAEPVNDISIITYNGSIELETPPDFSGKVEAITKNGSINSDLGITVSGVFSRSRLTGSIGSGEGRLYLETHNGSIRIR